MLAVIEGLTYFVELSGPELLDLVARPNLVTDLQRSGAALSVAMHDLSAERKEAMGRLQAAGIPLAAWLTVEEENGYWLCVDNATRAVHRYAELRDWLRAAGLRPHAVGLDLEPPLEDARALFTEGRRALLGLLRRRRSRQALTAARQIYLELVQRIRDDGFRAETYQFPIIVDERQAGSTLLQRTLGIIDLPADREVLMLYESLLPEPAGALLVDSYGPDSQAIGVGLSGGGVPFVLQAIGSRRLQGKRLVDALRRARRYTPHLYVFSLEGCVESQSLTTLLQTSLEDDALPPSPLLAGGRLVRAGLNVLLRTERLLAGN